ncbi:MAG: Crp/Fnr family transcriptional regulator [Pyrinomonadaceae bacterium]
MKTANNIRIQDKCQNCEIHKKNFFCSLPEADLEQFQSIKVTKAYRPGALLFVEGQPAKSVYMLCQGRVKLSTCSRSGKVMILGIAEAGDVIGLSAAISESDYEMTAEVLELCQVNYVETSDLLSFLEQRPLAAINAARQLGRSFQAAFDQICSIGMSDSAAEKLAKLFLGWTTSANGNGHVTNGRIQIKSLFTHEEIAEMIGSSRETVTRALKQLRERDLITLKGGNLIIHDKQRLLAAVGRQRS